MSSMAFNNKVEQIEVDERVEQIGQWAIDNGRCHCFGWHIRELEPLGWIGFVLLVDPEDPEYPWGVEATDEAKRQWKLRKAH